MKKTALVLLVTALLAAPAMAQVDFSRYVALGDSLTAGVASGSIMDYYQLRAYPQLLANQAGAGLLQGPFVAPPGLEPILELESLSPLVIDSTDMLPPADPFAYFYNLTLESPYQNLGLSGANTNDLLTKTGNALNLAAGNFDNVVYDVTLRVPQQPDPNTGEMVDYTAMVAAIGQQPTFVTVWIGNNDVLGAVLGATPIEGITMTPVDSFAADYGTLIGGLAMSLPSAQIVVLDVFGDARWIPFTTSVSITVDVPGVGTVPLMGEDGPLVDGDYLTLPAASLIGQGVGLPIPGSPPLPENLDPATGAPGVILRAAEIDVINERIATFNSIIAATADQFPNVHLYSINELFAEIVAGHYQRFGGIHLTTDFLTGGIFSYDGFHPQNIGQAVVAEGLIEFLNENLNAGLPMLDMYSILTEGGWNGVSPAALLGGGDPKQARLTDEAFLQLYRLMLPEMAARWQTPQQLDRDVSAAD
ncbi:MAG: SGNH/GDSL hydrolase family protein [Thermoanaerobaculales bacterium]|nr:SGNH/GDSL hydrolase family protein [Thermoanaerobaculales bacterium]